jgi:hypothetical protein
MKALTAPAETGRLRRLHDEPCGFVAPPRRSVQQSRREHHHACFYSHFCFWQAGIHERECK